METAAVRCYGTGGCGSGWKRHQCHVTAPVSGVLSVNSCSALLRHRWVGVRKMQQFHVTAPVALGSAWKLQQCYVTSPVAGDLTGNCISAILQHQKLGV